MQNLKMLSINRIKARILKCIFTKLYSSSAGFEKSHETTSRRIPGLLIVGCCGGAGRGGRPIDIALRGIHSAPTSCLVGLVDALLRRNVDSRLSKCGRTIGGGG